MSGGGTSDLLKTGLQVGGSIGSALLGKSAVEDASKAEIGALREGQQISQAAIKQGRGDILATAEPSLTDLISGYQGAISTLEQPYKTGAEFVETPGQQFLRQQQEQSLLRNQSAIGGLGGGRVREALQQAAFGRAATAQGDERSLDEQRKMNIANILSGGGENLAQFRGSLGANLANLSLGGGAQQIGLTGGIGRSQAQAQMLSNQAIQQGLSGLTGTLGQMAGR